MKKTTAVVAGIAFMATIATAGCGNEPGMGTASRDKAGPTPVTLTMLDALNFDDETFESLFARPVRARFPHVTLEHVRWGTGTTIKELAAAKQVPDILFGGNAVINQMQEMDVISDLTEWIESSKLDMSVFDKQILETLRLTALRQAEEAATKDLQAELLK